MIDTIKKAASRVLVGAVALLGVPTLAMAALPTEAATAFTDLGTAVTDIMAAIWLVVPVVVVGFFIIRLFKRGARAAG
jgi:hypothetical protein